MTKPEDITARLRRARRKRLLDRLLGSSPDQVHRRLKKRGWYDG